MMEWSDVRIFLAVARAGALGSAARALKLSHPTVGRRIRALEEDTGQTLFQRTSDGLVMTEAGRSIFELAEQMEASALALERRFAGESDEPKGMIRISAVDWFSIYVLPPVIAELKRLSPCILPELVTGSRLFDLSRREADLVFRILPFSASDVVQRRLMTIRYGLYAATTLGDPAKDGEGASIIVMDTALDHYPDVTWLRRMLPRAKTTLRSNNRSLQAHMCAAKMGYAVLPRPVGDSIAGLRLVDLGEQPPGRDIWMGYHYDLRRMSRLRAVVDATVRVLADEIDEIVTSERF